MLLRRRAPELALLLADRAVSAAQNDRADKATALQADHLAVFALNRLGRHAEAVHRLVPAIRDADTPPELRHELHVELAHCAAVLEEPAIALGAVHPVLAVGDDVAPALRGGALVAVAEASAALGCEDLVTSMLEEADELYREDPSLDHDTALLLRAAVRATDAARQRTRGAADEAEAKAREGLELLASLADPDYDSGEVSARLMHELALILLDRGAGEDAMIEVRPLLRRPVRAAAAAAGGRLRLVLATRVHLAEGRHEPALTLLADAVEGAQRYGMDAVLAECLEGLSHVHEARDEFADALHCMRAARAAEDRHLREVAVARSTLREHCGSARRDEARLVSQVAELLGNAGIGSAGFDADTELVNPEMPVASPPNGIAAVDAPMAQGAETELQVRTEIAEVAAADAEVAVVEAAEAERAQPEDTTVRPPAATDSAKRSVAAATEAIDGVTAIGPGVDEPTTATLDVTSPGDIESWQSRARHRRSEVNTLVSVSDLVPASGLSAGRSGRRRAEELDGDQVDRTSTADIATPRPEQAVDGLGAPSPSVLTDAVQIQPSSESSAREEGGVTGSESTEDVEPSQVDPRELPVSGPPPAPVPSALGWTLDVENPEADGDTRQMGLGDLLAEALAAYQQGRDVHPDIRATDASIDAAAANTDNSHEMPRYPGPGAPGMADLALAPNPSGSSFSASKSSEADHEGSFESITGPMLRLPDRTAEPQWAPSETGRRPAAGG
jgi:tetratricopeptide (TPR) repeat protein